MMDVLTRERVMLFLESRRLYERIAAGNKGGGQFRGPATQIIALLKDWSDGKGSDDPIGDLFKEIRDPKIRRAKLRNAVADMRRKAVALGDQEQAARLTPRRGATENELKTLLYQDAKFSSRGQREKSVVEKPTAKFTLQGEKYRDKDVAVYKDADGRPSLFFESDAGKRGGLVEKFQTVGELQQWAKSNGEPRLAAWAGRERKKLPEHPVLDLYTPAEVQDMAKGLDMTDASSHKVVIAEGKRRIETVLDEVDRMVADGGSNRALLAHIEARRKAGAPKAVTDELATAVESGDKSRLRALSAGIRAKLDEAPKTPDLRKRGIGGPEVEHKKRLAEMQAEKAAKAKAEPAQMRNPWNGPPSTKAVSTDGPFEAEALDPNYAAAPDSEVFDAPDSEVRKAVEDAWYGLTGGQEGEWVKLADLRERIGPKYPFRQVNRVLLHLSRERDVDVIGELNQKTLTQRDRDARINIGYQPAHLLMFDGAQAKRIRSEHSSLSSLGVPGASPVGEPGSPAPAKIAPAKAVRKAAPRKSATPPADFDVSTLEGLTTRQKRARLKAMGFTAAQIDDLAPTAAMAKKVAPAPKGPRPSGLPHDRKPESGDFEDLAVRLDGMSEAQKLEIFQDLSASELARLARKFPGGVSDSYSGRLTGLRLPEGLTTEEKRQWLAKKLSQKTWHWRSADFDEDDILRAGEDDEDELRDDDELDDEPVDEMDLALEHYEPLDAAARSRALAMRAVGHDVTPGHDELHHYWTRGPGLAKWAGSPKPWTTLVAHLTKYVGPEKAKVFASRWFIEVFHYAAGSDLNRVTHGHPPRGHRVGPG